MFCQNSNACNNACIHLILACNKIGGVLGFSLFVSLIWLITIVLHMHIYIQILLTGKSTTLRNLYGAVDNICSEKSSVTMVMNKASITTVPIGKFYDSKCLEFPTKHSWLKGLLYLILRGRVWGRGLAHVNTINFWYIWILNLYVNIFYVPVVPLLTLGTATLWNNSTQN